MSIISETVAKKVYASASEIIHHLWAFFHGDGFHITGAAIQPAHQVANAEVAGVDPLAVNVEGMLRRGVDAFAFNHQRDKGGQRGSSTIDLKFR